MAYKDKICLRYFQPCHAQNILLSCRDKIEKIEILLLLSCVCLFVCFVALRPKSTAKVMAGRSVYLTTLFPGQA